MEAAKNAVKNFTSKKGHQTSVDEQVHPHVLNETVKPHEHHETTQAIDKEVHQHHYHTTVQPIAHEETLPEQHHHKALPTQHREIHHEDPSHTKASVDAELARFQPSSKTVETTTSQAAAPAVTGEHVHHHVHENVVPVVHKSTVQPHVVHTTQPIHETHHAPAQHHGISQLPMKTLDEFKAGGGVLHGGEQGLSKEEYDGCPRPYNEKLSTTFDKLGLHSSGGQGQVAAGGAGKGHQATDSGVGMGVVGGQDGLVPGHKGDAVGGSGVRDAQGTGAATTAGVDARHANGAVPNVAR